LAIGILSNITVLKKFFNAEVQYFTPLIADLLFEDI